MAIEALVILLAEDDEGHAVLVRKNIARAGIENQIVHVTDGQEALDYIYCQGRFAGRAPEGPLLAILDINMPRLDGVSVLMRLKTDEARAKIPIIMLTTTDDPREIVRCYAAGCSVYITKPVDYTAFCDAVTRLGLFLQVVQVPSEASYAATH
jgi:CheY-like chemotaxis protein